jgi:hypothetical protein
VKKEDIKLGVPDEEGQVRIMFSKGGPRKGAGRKGIGVTKKMSLTLSEELWGKLEQHSEIVQQSRSELVRTIIERFFTMELGNEEIKPNAD